MKIRLPNPPNLEDKKLQEYLERLVKALENAFEKAPDTPFTRDRIKVTNLTKQFTFDATSGTLNDTRMVLGTILHQLQEAGKIS